MSIFTKFWDLVKHIFGSDLAKVAIAITQDVNIALKSGVPDAIIAAIDPNPDHIPEELLAGAKALIPKVMAAELGLVAVAADATPEAAQSWVESIIEAFGSATLVRQSKVWNSLATQLTILFDNGKTQGLTWIQWANKAEEAFQDVQKAVADSKVAAIVKADPVQDPAVVNAPAPPQIGE